MGFLRASSFAFICLIIVIIIPAALCNYQPFSGRQPGIIPSPLPAGSRHHVDYTLAIQWGRTVCGKNPNRQRFCKSLPREFTIHGLWSYGQELQPCIAGNPFDRTLLGNKMKGELNSFWIDAEHNNNEGFWNHEYYNHGRCAITYVSTEYQQQTFFQMALSAFKAVNFIPKRSGSINYQIPLANVVKYVFRGSETYIHRIFRAELSHIIRAELSQDFAMMCNGKSQVLELRFQVRLYKNREWRILNNPFRAIVFLP